MKKLLILGGAVALSLLPLAPAQAQQAPTTANVVGTCGTQTYVAGRAYPVTQDTTGAQCSSATFSGSITANNASVGTNAATAPTSSTQIGVLVGTALQPVSATNPVPISGSISATNPSVGATGSAVPASGTYMGMTVAGTLTGVPGTANGLKVDGSAVTQPVSISGNQAVNTAQVNGVTTLTGAGATGTGAQRVTASQDTTTVAGAAPLTTGIFVTGPSAAALGTAANQSSQLTQETASAAALGTTADTVCGSATGTCTLEALVKFLNNAATASTPAGTNLIGKVGIDQTTPGTTNGVQVNAALPAGTNLLGKAGIDQTTLGSTNGVSLVAATTGGTTPFTLTAANSTNATNIKASAGLVDHVSVYNISATPAWVSFYDTASAPTCGTAIKYQVLAPANSTSGAGAVEDYAIGVGHTSGIGICFTTGIAGTGSVAASSYVVNVFYK